MTDATPVAEAAPGTLVEATLGADPFGTEAFDAVPTLRETAKAAGGEGTLVGGPTAVERDVRQAMSRDMLVIPPLILAVVLGIVAVLLRAFLAPLVIAATVVLSFAAALGAIIVLFEALFWFPGEDYGLPLYGFLFFVALGVDYNIFLMARVREESARHGTREGLLRGLAVTGAVITAAGVVLAGTFSVLAVLPLIFLTEIGFLVAFGVLSGHDRRAVDPAARGRARQRRPRLVAFAARPSVTLRASGGARVATAEGLETATPRVSSRTAEGAAGLPCGKATAMSARRLPWGPGLRGSPRRVACERFVSAVEISSENAPACLRRLGRRQPRR